MVLPLPNDFHCIINGKKLTGPVLNGECALSCRLEKESLLQEKDLLLRKLLEAELDGTAAAKQVSALRDTVSHMSHSTSVCGVCHTLSFFLTKAEVFTLRLRDKKTRL